MKVFAPGGVASELERLASSSGNTGNTSVEDEQPEDVPTEPEKDQVNIATRMSLRSISMSGMALVEQSAEYLALFGDSEDAAGKVSAWDMKRLELNLESFLWTYYAQQTKESQLDECLCWNFGSAQDEVDAVAVGGKTKLVKINKQLDQQRVLLDLAVVRDRKLEEKLKNMQLFFVGPVSTLKNKDAVHLGNIFGIPFYVLPLAAPTLANSVIVPAWQVASINKWDKATVTDWIEPLKVVTQIRI